MSFKRQIDKIDKAKDPTPAEHEEENEYNDVYHTHSPEHDGKSYKQFHYPTYERNDKKNYLQKTVLTVKPFIKSHNVLLEKYNFPSFIILSILLSYVNIRINNI